MVHHSKSEWGIMCPLVYHYSIWPAPLQQQTDLTQQNNFNVYQVILLGRFESVCDLFIFINMIDLELKSRVYQ